MSQSTPQYSITYPRFQVKRTFLRFLARSLFRLLTRTTIEGLENIPREGPVILAGNHVAELETVLMTVIPKRLVEPIGAGDIPFEGIFDKIAAYYGIIPINRGNLDRKGMNQALDVLKQGGVVGIFPEGGTWEPGRMAPQIGVALLSQRTGTPVVPIGFSGMQGALKHALHLKRPKLLMKIGEPIPALNVTDSRVDKDQLMAYSGRVLDAIYDLISQEDKDLLPLEARHKLSLEIEGEGTQNVPWGPAFAHFLHSPVLLKRFIVNLKLPVEALYGQNETVDMSAMQTALKMIADYLKKNPAFFTYRFGMEEGSQVAAAIQGLQSLLEKAKKAGKLVRITTRRVITYKNGRLETSEKHFVIEPGNLPG